MEVGRAINRTRNGAFRKGRPFCDKGVEFSFGFTAFVVLGIDTGADGWNILERSVMDGYTCKLKPPLTVRAGTIQK